MPPSRRNGLAALLVLAAAAAPDLHAAAAPSGAPGLTEAQFREYIECFNRRDYECFGKYYAEDVVLSKGPKWPPLHGREAIFGFYRDVDAHGLREHMEIHDIRIEGNVLRADLEASFEASRDWPDFGSRVVKAGDAWQLRGILQYQIADGRFVHIAPAPRECARECLEGFVNDYLAALVARDPARVALAPSARHTENGRQIQPGEGLWRTVTGVGAYRIHVVDPVAGQAGFIGELREGDQATMFALRLAVVRGEITEVETIIGRSFRPNHPSMVTAPRPSLSVAVPPAERLTRSQMMATVNSNFDGILADRGDIFADDCQRIENRMPMSGNPALNYPITPLPDRPLPHFGSMGCREQIEAHLFDTLDAVEPRRMLVLDEERQLVFGIYMLRFYGRTACNDIPGYGRTCPRTEQKPISLRSAEVLGVRGGRIHEVEVVFTRDDYDAQTGWE